MCHTSYVWASREKRRYNNNYMYNKIQTRYKIKTNMFLLLLRYNLNILITFPAFTCFAHFCLSLNVYDNICTYESKTRAPGQLYGCIIIYYTLYYVFTRILFIICLVFLSVHDTKSIMWGKAMGLLWKEITIEEQQVKRDKQLMSGLFIQNFR